MSGGSWEYVMGNYNDVVGQSGFVSMPESKYYDKYTSDDASTACNGSACISHALLETLQWSTNGSNMVNNMLSWFLRGGYWGDGNPSLFVFSHSYYFGGDYSAYSFRLVMGRTSS